VVIRGCTMAHVERMSKREVFIGLYNDFNEHDEMRIWVYADKKGKLHVTIHP